MVKVTLAGALFCAAAFAQHSNVPGWFLAGTNPKAFEIGVDDSISHGGKRSAHILCLQSPCTGFGTLMQTFRADRYRGRRVRLSAWVKADQAGPVSIWMRVDGADATLAFDNMQNRQSRGSFGWKRVEIVLDVPDEAVTVTYGLILQDSGQAWVDDFVFEAVDGNVQSTNMMSQPAAHGNMLPPERLASLPPDAVNKDFELPPGA
jgi:hypothetical protein